MSDGRTRLQARSADGTRISVEVHEPERPGSPTVVLVHGWTCAASVWEPVIAELAGRVRVVAYDQRGHGASDPAGPGRCSTGALADDLAAVLDAAVPAGELPVLAGHSMGGMAIMAVAGRGPLSRRASGVLLASTACLSRTTGGLPLAGGLPSPAELSRHLLLTSPLPLGPVTAISRAALRYLTLGPGASGELTRTTAAMVHACDRRTRAAWGRVMVNLDLTGALAGIDVPARVLVGSRDRLTPPPHARRIASLLPRCAGLTELPGAGHMTPLEDPGTVARLIRELAAGVPAAGVPAAGATAASARQTAAGGPGPGVAGSAASGSAT
ncbi:MAG: alpha/beta hydrolase [Actinobacteria bacterium]|nr:alpha/beta hydrolase [Actinomycetota bacterium]